MRKTFLPLARKRASSKEFMAKGGCQQAIKTTRKVGAQNKQRSRSHACQQQKLPNDSRLVASQWIATVGSFLFVCEQQQQREAKKKWHDLTYCIHDLFLLGEM